MFPSKRGIIQFFLGVMVSATLGATFNFLSAEAVPYSDVELISIQELEDPRRFAIKTGFFKFDNCEFKLLQVFGNRLGEWEYLEYSTIEHGDRLEGGHTLELVVFVPNSIDEIEIRTRHICDGEKSDNVFINIPIQEE